ncbi:unnamed protein product [Ixodes hexagonus]
MSDDLENGTVAKISKEAIIPIVFNGKPYFPGKQVLTRTSEINETVERKLPLLPLEDDPMQRDWDEFLEDFPQCSHYLEPGFLDQKFPTLRKSVAPDDSESSHGGTDKVVVYDVDVKDFQPEDIRVRVRDGNVLVVGKTEKILNGGGKYSMEELLGGIRVPEDVEDDDVLLETTPDLRLRVSTPDSRPGSAMSSAPSSAHSSAPSSADTSLAER